ncbi:hypothetical protein RF11_13471 [Thelohanellus kitauei]|uniref:Uncharacterized protein n=1 Tax=Thelohanellus kitauei TaxID=669202 RepID=A0A0C2MIU0_THEKT|nr:hypothetical protein RF11_13471 [Thelohanellus kitauei]
MFISLPDPRIMKVKIICGANYNNTVTLYDNYLRKDRIRKQHDETSNAESEHPCSKPTCVSHGMQQVSSMKETSGMVDESKIIIYYTLHFINRTVKKSHDIFYQIFRLM